MKNLLTIFWTTIIGFAALSSCSNDDELAIYKSETAIAPILTTTINQSYALTQEASEAVFAEFTFEKADFLVGTPIKYSLEMTLATDEAFENAKRIDSSNDTKMVVKNSKINALLLELNNGAIESTAIIFRVRAEMMGETNGTGIFIDSTVTATTITPYDPEWGVFGQINDGNWVADVMMTNNNGVWTSDEITIQGEFRIRLDRAWVSDRGAKDDKESALELDKAIEVKHGGKNLTVTNVDPIQRYIVTYDSTVETITVTAK